MKFRIVGPILEMALIGGHAKLRTIRETIAVLWFNTLQIPKCVQS